MDHEEEEMPFVYADDEPYGPPAWLVIGATAALAILTVVTFRLCGVAL